jgi:O-antigen/teichoic acid export membrane protein
MDAPASPKDGAAEATARRLIVKNTLYLTVSQALTVPLSVFVNAMSARYLGAEAFGYVYLANTLCAFGFLAVTWGHEGVLPAEVAKNNALAGVMLGSSLAWRAVLSVVVYGVLALASVVLGYDSQLHWALGLTALCFALTSFLGACKDTIRGLERTDIPAYAQVGQQLLVVVLIVPVLLAGGTLNHTIAAQAVVAAIVLAFVWRALRPAGIRTVSVRWDVVKSLFTGGTPFVVFAIAMVLQPNIDAVILSKFAPTDVMGWYAIARRLVGLLVFPAGALIGALYPTLSRLYTEDLAAYKQTASGALRAVSLLVVPVALGTALFPDIGAAIFGREAFGRAGEDLQILAVFLFLLYFSMPLGTAVLASGKRKSWSVVQSLCVGVSAGLDPLLVPWFQHRTSNGALGLCIATVISEALVVGCGIALAPRGVFDRRLVRSILLALVAGGAMAAAAYVARPLTSFVAAPISVLVYGVALLLTGAVEKEQAEAMKDYLGRKLRFLKRP